MFGTTSRQHHSHLQHHHFPNHCRGTAIAPTALSPESAKAGDLFDTFIAASTFKSVLHQFRLICDVLKVRPTSFRQFYPILRNNIRSWKAQALWNKYDKRASHKCYNEGKAATNVKVLIIGSGPCGLRAAIEAQLLGAKVVVVEKRDRFSRNNVLHLWPFVIADLKALGAKKFYGKFCAGAIDHISIRQLQCILLKVALLLGVEVIEGVAFEDLLQPPEDQSQRTGWHAKFSPAQHPVNHYEFDVLIGADGKRNTLLGFKRKEFRGKLAIAITANFINRHTEQEARVQEISGVAFIFNQKFFKELYAETGIDLENIVYYKDETHYFVMTAKKHSLINKGVIMADCSDTQQLLHANNVDRDALCNYAREAADFSTNYLLPHTDFAVNHYGKPDIAMFDFTSMFAAENACRVIQKNGHKLLNILVGDSLLEPFWPTGSGCARGFLSSFDACWAIRSWASDSMTPLEVIAERESIYRLLGQTTPENLAKDILSYTLEPSSRYPTINLKSVLPFQVRHLRATDQPEEDLQQETQQLQLPRKRKRRDSIMHPDTLLAWCQKQVEHHPNISVNDLDASFKNGMALCSIIHRFRPFYIDLTSLEEDNVVQNNQLAFDILEKEFAISPVMTGSEMASSSVPDRLAMISYLSQVCDVFRGQIPQYMGEKKNNEDMEDFPAPVEGDLPRTNLVKSETSRSEGNLLKCKILNTKENISKDTLYRSKKRRSEVGSLDKLDRELKKPTSELTDNFSDRIKDLEGKFRIGGDAKKQKPKELVRAIGKLEKTDWNMAAIEKKINENTIPGVSNNTEKVPKWSRESYNDKQFSIEKRLRENGEDEDRIAKYLDIDASLKRMERKLKEGSTLDVGLRGHNKVSNLANQLASKLVRKEQSKTIFSKQPKAVVLPTCGSDLCYFCSTRVYLVERMSAEGKFFHRKCFKCSYCHSLLRLGNYIYDREGRFGGHFFCIPHFGMPPKAETKRRQLPLMAYNNKARLNGEQKNGSNDALFIDTTLVDGRGTTPERAEFENSLVEQSDEEEYLSEDEWTDRNFGMSANELDETTDSECSDFCEDDEDQLEYEIDYQMSAEETKRLAEKWKRRYSSNPDAAASRKSESDDLSEERGADGDESHTATEGEYEDDVEDDGEAIKRARALRRQELNINVNAPIIQTSDSGSDTEVPTEDESDESDTHIDTDSDFAEDPPVQIAKIIITESNSEEDSSKSEDEATGDKTMRSGFDSSNKSSTPKGPNPHTEHLQRLLKRTESTEAMTARRNQLMRQNYLLGSSTNVPKRSASFADVGDRFKNFMDKISATQTKLKPAAQPSAAMQAFLKGSQGSSLVAAPVGFPSSDIKMDLPSFDIKKCLPVSNIAKSGLTSVGIAESTEKSVLSKEIDRKLKEVHGPQVSNLNQSPSQNTDLPLMPSVRGHNDSEGFLFAKESNLDTVLADTKNVGVTDKMFNFLLDGDVVEAINEEIMTSNAQSSDEENDYEILPCLDDKSVPNINKKSKLEDSALNQFNISVVTESREPVLHQSEYKHSKNVSGFPCEQITVTNKKEWLDEDDKKRQLDNVVIDICPIRQQIEVNKANITTAANNCVFNTNKADITINTKNPNHFDCRTPSPLQNTQTSTEDVSHIFDCEEGSDENDDIDIDFDQLAGEALHDLHNLQDITIDGISPTPILTDTAEINLVCDDIPIVMSKISSEADNKRAAISKKVQEEFNDFEEEFGWAEENAIDSAAEEFTVSEIEDSLHPSIIKLKLAAVPAQTSKLVESRDLEYMDTSSESSSSDSTEDISYNELQDIQSPVIDEPKEDMPIITSHSQSSISHNLNRSVEKSHSFDNKKIFGQVRPVEQPPESSFLLDSYKIGGNAVRYEGYLPRFKDRGTPLRYDSISVKKNSTFKPLFTPSKDIKLDETVSNSLIESPARLTIAAKPKDGDLVRDMVMSRITKLDKGNRRGSRGSLLMPSGSRSSLLGDILPDTSGSLGSLSGFSNNANNPVAIHESNVSKADVDSEKVIDNSVEPNCNLLFDNFSRRPKNITSTPYTPPQKCSENSSMVSPHYKLNDDCDPFEYNTLDEDSHLINRKKSMASRPRPLETFDPSVRSREVCKQSKESRALRHLDCPVPLSSDSTSPQLEIFAGEPTPTEWDTFSSSDLPHERPRRASESEVESGHSDVPVGSNKAISQWNVADKVNTFSEKETRLKKLLSEHRKKEYESTKSKNVDSCVRDCLEEYRQKRYSAPSPHLIGVASNADKVSDSMQQRNTKRPSVLELESLQVFTSPSGEAEHSLVASEANSQPEMRKQKKSKDRERRRSLIQVVAGMFNKSDDKKKCEDNSKEAIVSVEASSSESYSSPSVRERFSKLRLSKSKEKTNDRSDAGRRECNESLQSPTTLSPRNLFSFLTKSTERKVQPSAEDEDDEQRKGSRDLTDGQQTPSTRRHKAALRAAKQAEHKRLRIAQEIQRQLEECEIKTRELEDKGIRVEKALRGETDNVREETDLMRDWFSLVHERNALSRWEQELTVKARELQLEDRHMRLENELRQRMACPESDKKRFDIDREGIILAEMLAILEQKDSLVSLLEEDRKRYLEEDKDLKKVMEKKGLRLPLRQRGL